MQPLHRRATAIARHLEAPLLEERKQFLEHRLSMGTGRVSVRSLAATLLQVVRLLELKELREVSEQEIEVAGERWARDSGHHSYRKAGRHSKHVLRTAARSFLRYHGALKDDIPHVPFQRELSQYLELLRNERSLAETTVNAHHGHVRSFLKWVPARYTSLAQVTIPDVLDYLKVKETTCSRPSVCTAAQSLRSFFHYGEDQGWMRSNLSSVLVFPKRIRYSPDTYFPSWTDMRRLLDGMVGETIRARRDHAILLLCAVYGLRSSEVARLRLDDIDWSEETLTVTRSKHGGTQIYPLQFEVGEAIRRYLTVGRPACACRTLFVTFYRPFRPVHSVSLSMMARREMARAGLQSSRTGTHAFRHAAATELLRLGTGLRDIAEFLGHKNMKTVSVYVRTDEASLKEAGDFSLGSVR